MNYHEGIYGNTALHFAMQSGHHDAADLLISYGADRNAINNKELTPDDVFKLLQSDYFEDQFQQQQLEALGNITPYDPYDSNYCSYN